jgi:hypothetical protein
LGLLTLKRSNTSRLSGQLSDNYDVLENGVVVFRIFKVSVAPEDRPWMWPSGDNGTTAERMVGRWHRIGVLFL